MRARLRKPHQQIRQLRGKRQLLVLPVDYVFFSQDVGVAPGSSPRHQGPRRVSTRVIFVIGDAFTQTPLLHQSIRAFGIAPTYFVLPKVLYQSDMVLLQVTWSPFPRPIRVEHAIGTGDTMKDDPTKGIWERLVPAKPGTVIYLAAFQDAPGTLMCRVTRGGQELSHDTNARRKEISLVNAVKCISGG